MFLFVLRKPFSKTDFHISVFVFLFLVPEEKYLTLEGFHKFAVDRARQDIRSIWRAILACGYDLHFER